LPDAPAPGAAIATAPGWRTLPDGRVAHPLDGGGALAARRLLQALLVRAT
jgi:hypothetical protein